MTSIRAKEILNKEFPTDAGTNLAKHILNLKGIDWPNLEIDLRGCPPSQIISGFFNAFLQTIADKDLKLCERARTIKWVADYEFQMKVITERMSNFVPYGK